MFIIPNVIEYETHYAVPHFILIKGCAGMLIGHFPTKYSFELVLGVWSLAPFFVLRIRLCVVDTYSVPSAVVVYVHGNTNASGLVGCQQSSLFRSQ